MITFIEPLYKDTEKIVFGWNPEPAIVTNYRVYVGLSSLVGSLTALAVVGPNRSGQPSTLGKVVYESNISDVQAALSIPSTWNFSNKVFYYAITYYDASGVESSIADSRVVMVPPTGILGKEMKEDPTINRHLYVFSDERQRWVKVAGSSGGSVAVDSSEFYLLNTITERSYDASGNVTTSKTYLSDATISGAYAKLVSYEYSDTSNPTKPTKITVTDSTV